jgi:glutamate/tyrosine decarboxylase-like PLP-dependent enzyme
MANYIGTLVARTHQVGTEVRASGMTELGLSQVHRTQPTKLTAYTSIDAHGCVAQALELAGIGSDQLRRIPVNARHQIDISQLEQAIAHDRKAQCTPFLVVGSAGTVDVGAVDDLAAMSSVAKREGLWFHVDGACGALGMLSKNIAPQLRGIQLADSIALDFHKWGQVPYDAGFVLVRDSQLHHDTFASPAAYLRRESRGMAAGSPWPCDFGPDLSRSFKALKVWFTFQVYGADRLGRMMDRTCELAQYLASRIEQVDALELLAPVTLNIVPFRYSPGKLDSAAVDQLNAELVVAIQESGLAAPSSTTVDGKVAIRAAIFNHRTTERELDKLLELAVDYGRELQQRIS